MHTSLSTPWQTDLFLKNPSRFADIARSHVEKHARQGTSAVTPPARPREDTPAPFSSLTVRWHGESELYGSCGDEMVHLEPSLRAPWCDATYPPSLSFRETRSVRAVPGRSRVDASIVRYEGG